MSTVPATTPNQVLSQFELAIAQQAMARIFPEQRTEYVRPRQSTTPLADRSRACVHCGDADTRRGDDGAMRCFGCVGHLLGGATR